MIFFGSDFKHMRYTNILGIVAVVTAAMVGSVDARPVRVELGTLAPKNSSYHRALLAMGQEWRKAPGDGVRLKVFPNGVIGSESDMVREMRLGGIQAALLTATGLSDIEPMVGGLQSLPMMFRDLEEFDFVYKKLQPDLEAKLRAKGFVVLFWSDAGWVHFFSTSPLVKPADLKSMKIYTSASVPGSANVWRAGGYHPVALEPSNILSSLQTGMIDAATVPPIFALAARVDTAAPNMLSLNWSPLLGAAVIRESAWNQVPVETQQFLLSSAKKAGEQIVTKARAEGEESVIAMKKRGLKVADVSEVVEKEWVQAVAELRIEIRGELVSDELFDRVESLLKEYRASR
jgi:TRAP-type C4-dicarboxylate transport system substrate-binding protein